MNRQSLRRRNRILFIVTTLIVALAICAFVYFGIKKYRSSEIRQATIEAGDPITLELFDDPKLRATSFITDISSIDTTVPAMYGIKVNASGYEINCVLYVKDTTAPQGEAVPQDIFAGMLPDAQDCVTNITDMTEVTVEYAQAEPDVSSGGQYDIPVRLIDASGNQTVISVPFTVTDDHTAPVISGTHDIECFIGDSIVYKDGVTVEDDYTAEPELTVDTSEVNFEEEGVYPVTYIATDDYGNESSVTVNLTLTVKPEDYVDIEIVFEKVEAVLAEVTTDDMSDIEKLMCGVRWARYNLHYVEGTSSTTEWTRAASDGFDTRTGSCFMYYSVVKAFMEYLGFENMMIERYPVYSVHYWNLVNYNGQWYHCDATPFLSFNGYYFLRTDAEMDGSHRFDESLYPDRATESIQDRIDYSTFTIDEG